MAEIDSIRRAATAESAAAALRSGGQSPPTGSANGATGRSASFAEALRARQGIAESGRGAEARPLQFSAHAQTRLQSRKIALDSGHIQRLNGAVEKAAGKGSRDALVLMDNLAMVVSVKNRTVVTVVDSEHMKQSVFTNIDSAVIA